ncbi:glycosyltransferase family 4 protein [Vibrio lentus]|uniref:Glycosyl transferase family 1 domain-containing protein n=1 Tax=Vibrio lentus TaxID=136468 RepID=A0A855IPW6_9VIBR|nr:glycosyltransferase family 4 protein [Vibrio lentus]PMJ65807.1 hypothetical protein BCU18_12715 [Vibrio lentus]PMJ88129.1 hypothetical protein BCU14_25310 [Vibrio lentus]PMM58018.1 hypothetical protein BCT50_22950 [Vibrio lentus]PMN41939.1 hypothetical protein BCT33_00305 [Vibrio lentus]PMN59192.1 hypothetical protein BCT29_25050 [Vibrio lentus]
MRAVFIHDHIFKECNGKFYSEGKLTLTTWQRYLDHIDNLIVIGRSEHIDESSVNEYSLSSSESIVFKCVKSIKPIDRLLTSKIDSFLESIIIDCDFVICRLPSFLGIRAFYMAKKLNKKTVIELVGCPYDALKFHGSIVGKILAPIERLKLRKVIKRSDDIIYVTNEFLQQRYPTSGNTIGISNVELMPSQFKYKNRKGEDNFKIGFIGSLNAKYKGLHDLIKAISKLNNTSIELHVLGSGDNQKYIDLAESFQMSKQLHFHKPIKGGERVLEWLSQYDLYVQPSHTEGLPRALIEAMSIGLPCIGSRVGGIPELLPETALFEAKNCNELSYKIGLYVNSSQLRQQQSDINRKIAKGYYFDILAAKRTKFMESFFDK